MLVLTLGMGLGRFLYTPMLQSCWRKANFPLANSHGSPVVLCRVSGGEPAVFIRRVSFTLRLRPFLLASALATGLLILARRGYRRFFWFSSFAFWRESPRRDVDFRLNAHHATYPPSLCLAALFSGVGVGIALGNEYVRQACILPSLHRRCGKVPEHFCHYIACSGAAHPVE